MIYLTPSKMRAVTHLKQSTIEKSRLLLYYKA